ncbi:MAG: hypothetical protein QE273_07700 [Verrucomicrobiales bacterium]|nr:hypothetical protein [Verrucomicrobiales bacterium]
MSPEEASHHRAFLRQFSANEAAIRAFVRRLFPAQIGNWDQQDRKLSGRIGQLVVLGRAMSDGEIAALHEAGTPYR